MFGPHSADEAIVRKLVPEGARFRAAEGECGPGTSDDGRQGEGGMTVVGEPVAAPAALRKLEGELRAVLAESEQEIDRLAQEFESLAQQTQEIVATTGDLVRCSESEAMTSVLPRVRALGAAGKNFIRERLAATEGILATVTAEGVLLERLGGLTRGQKAMVRETEMLRVLTNIEVARLGEVGAGFQYLARELDDFSRSVAQSTGELIRHTEERRRLIEETRHTLTRELPGMREAFGRIEKDLDAALGGIDASLGQLSGIPARFRAAAEEIAGQIAGVVAAVQGHDFTRQQIEHVCAALGAIVAALGEGGEGAGELRAGLKIQSCQLRNARETVKGWTSQIRSCLDSMGRIASSEIPDLAPLVLGQERELSSQLAQIERIEEECAADNARVQASFAGLSGLMQLVDEHLARSRSVRDRLQLLMFNSIVEASHLGTRADGILEISTTIKRISAAWEEITRQTEAATGEIRGRVEESGETLRTFSEDGNGTLRAAQAETRGGMEILREGAACANRQGREIEEGTQNLKVRMAEIGAARDRIEACMGRLESAIAGIEAVGQELANDGAPETCDAEAVERRFSAGYTTEMERQVLRAALHGGPLPVAQAFTGNSVELF
jgi:hypothetical protein